MSGCVSDGQLLAFFTGDLPASERAGVLEHLDGCELCQAVLATLAQEGKSKFEQLGPYRLLKRLGRGGMGEVFLAERDDGAQCVVKRLLPELSADRDFQRRFRQEAPLLARLEHPNIGRLLDFGEVDGASYLALELIDGIDLRGLLNRFKDSGSIAPAGLTVELIRQAALGLGAAHRALDARGEPLNLIHRDVSPGNLMVSTAGVVKVIDFGMAQAAINEATATGIVLGKLQYFSPEQARGGRLDARTDIFSLGLVMQELLTGRRSYGGSRPRKLSQDVAAGRTGDAPVDVWVIPRLWELSRRCVAPEPSGRFASMQALVDALAQAQKDLSLALTPEAISAMVR